MNKRQIVASLIKIANELDNNGLYKEANTITKVMVRIAEEDNSKLERAIERFKRSCENISKLKIPYQEKLTERSISAREIMETLEGEDEVKFEKATHNIFVD
jgi:ribosomal protein S21